MQPIWLKAADESGIISTMTANSSGVHTLGGLFLSFTGSRIKMFGKTMVFGVRYLDTLTNSAFDVLP